MYAESFLLREDDLPPLSIGAGLLATGGGGSPYLGMLLARELIRAGAEIRIVPLEALSDDAWVAQVGSTGVPVIGFEKIELTNCFPAHCALEVAAGIKVSALISGEIGGTGSIDPIIVAAKTGLPIIDGDGIGRAFPEIYMTSFMINGAPLSPAVLADEKGNVVVIREVTDMFALERFCRTVSLAMGGICGYAAAPMRGDFVRRFAIPGVVSQALNIGRTVLRARANRQNVIEKLVEGTGAKLFFAGKVTDVLRQLKTGFSRGSFTIAGTGPQAGSEAKIAIQNEYLVLWIEGEAIITVPDLIMVAEADTGEPIPAEILRYGQRVAILGLPAHDLMRTPQAIKVVGPKPFGFPELTYKPLEC